MKAGQLPDSQEMEEVYETSPDGNGVNLEEQMIKSSQAAGDYQMVSNLYSRHVRILNAAMQGR
jgi:flagellar basal-body rod protein FlgB